jgi:hypothetical protein
MMMATKLLGLLTTTEAILCRVPRDHRVEIRPRSHQAKAATRYLGLSVVLTSNSDFGKLSCGLEIERAAGLATEG